VKADFAFALMRVAAGVYGIDWISRDDEFIC
jgi:hypothetical protein